MATEVCDVIVMGCGGFGSAAMAHLARRGLKVIGIDRFSPPHDQGSSHGETRIIRKAYFEHPNYVPLLHRAWTLWEELSDEVSQHLIQRRDLLMSGPVGSEVTEGARKSASLHRLALQDLTHAETQKRFPMFNLPPDHSMTVESTAGILWSEKCISAHLQLAKFEGAVLKTGETVLRIQKSGSNGLSVQTDRGTYSAAAGVVTCGAWTPALLPEYSRRISVVRKTIFWHPIQSVDWASSERAPLFLLDLPEGQFYGLPSVDGKTIKVGEHTGGQTITDPSALLRSTTSEDRTPIEFFVTRHLRHVAAEATRSSVCMYSMSPDGHFLFDRFTDIPLVIGAGFSGHGFKFTSVLGEAAADLIQHQRSSFDLQFLSSARFAADAATES